MPVANPFLPLAQDEGSSQGRFHTLNVTGSSGTLSVSGGVATIALTGGGSASLGLWDFWYESWIGNNATLTGGDYFSSAAISSGTNATNPPGGFGGSLVGYARQGAFLRSSVTPNSGYRYVAVSIAGTIFGGSLSAKFRCYYQPRTAFTNTTVRIGFHDTITNADATDGAYIELVGDNCVGKTSTASTRSTTGTSYTMTINTPYVFDLEVNAAGTEVTYRLYSGTTTTPVWTQTLTTNIPTSTSAPFGAGFVATNSGSSAVDIGVLYGLSIGTIAGHDRARGAL